MTKVRAQSTFNGKTGRILFPALSWVAKGYTLSIRMSQYSSVTSCSSPTPQKVALYLSRAGAGKGRVDKILLRRCDHRPAIIHISPQERTA